MRAGASKLLISRRCGRVILDTVSGTTAYSQFEPQSSSATVAVRITYAATQMRVYCALREDNANGQQDSKSQVKCTERGCATIASRKASRVDAKGGWRYVCATQYPSRDSETNEPRHTPAGIERVLRSCRGVVCRYQWTLAIKQWRAISSIQ